MQTSTVTTSSAQLVSLIEGVRAAVAASDDPAVVAEGVAAALGAHINAADLLVAEQLVPDPTHYRQHILHVEPDGSFSVVALVWLPGQATPIHDHVSWCVVGVRQGNEHETVYRLVEADGVSWLEPTGVSTNPTGSVAALVPPGDIHHVANQGDGLAVSLHVYGADIGVLGSSIRRRYDLEVRSPTA